MGQKVNPVGMRLGIVHNWNSRWYASSSRYREFLAQDLEARKYLQRKLAKASVSRIEIERPTNNARIVVHSSRPGIVIGKKGEEIDRLRKQLAGIMGAPVTINVEEIRKPELDAYLVAESVAQQIERRIMFRRAMKRAVTNTMRLGAEGIKILISGRLNGADIARSEWYREGRIPLHTLRARIDYGFKEARTTYGVIGVKVWVLKPVAAAAESAEEAPPPAAASTARATPSAPAAGNGAGQPEAAGQPEQQAAAGDAEKPSSKKRAKPATRRGAKKTGAAKKTGVAKTSRGEVAKRAAEAPQEEED